MHTLDTIEARRSVRRFDPAVVIDAPTARTLIAAAMRAPTALNLQHWKFVLARDPALRAALCEAAHGQPQVTQAGLYVLICGDTRAYETHLDAITRGLSPERRDHTAGMIRALYDGNLQRQHDEAIRSGALAAENLMLAAKDMGYDSVPMVGFDFEKTAALIRLPKDHIIVMAVAIGKALEPAPERTNRFAYEDVVFTDGF